MAYNYSTYVTTMANLLVVQETNPAFAQIVPRMIEHAEQRIYRELDLLSVNVVDATGVLSANTRTFTLPSAQGTFVVVNGINILSGIARTPVLKASREVIDGLWPSNIADTAATIPSMFAMLTDQTLLFGPPAGVNTSLEVHGTIRPATLSVTNATTFLTNHLPELFIAASMVFGSGYQRNFGAQSDDPKMSQSWEVQYQTLLGSAGAEEMRKKFSMMPRG